MPNSMDRRQLAAALLAERGHDLDALVAQWRAEGVGWLPISRRLEQEHGVAITRFSLMRWYGEPKPATATAA